MPEVNRVSSVQSVQARITISCNWYEHHMPFHLFSCEHGFPSNLKHLHYLVRCLSTFKSQMLHFILDVNSCNFFSLFCSVKDIAVILSWDVISLRSLTHAHARAHTHTRWLAPKSIHSGSTLLLTVALLKYFFDDSGTIQCPLCAAGLFSNTTGVKSPLIIICIVSWTNISPQKYEPHDYVIELKASIIIIFFLSHNCL